MNGNQPSRFLIYSALIAIQVLFGINYVVSKDVVGAFPPLVWASSRLIVSSLIMLAVAAAFRWEKRPQGGWKFFGPLLIYSLLGAIINQGSFLVGLRYTTATNSAILNTLIPVFTLLIVTLRGQEPLTPRKSVAFVLALCGVLALRKIEDFNFSNSTMIGDLLTMLNCLSYGFFLSYSKAFFERNDRVWATAWLFLYGSIGMTLIAWPDWSSFAWPTIGPALMGSMFYAIIGGTLITYFLSVWTLSYTKSSSVAFFVYLQPIVASTLAWGWKGEPPTLRTISSSLLIFGGLILAIAPDNALRRRKVAPSLRVES